MTRHDETAAQIADWIDCLIVDNVEHETDHMYIRALKEIRDGIDNGDWRPSGKDPPGEENACEHRERVAELEAGIETGGAMLRAIRSTMGMPGGIEPVSPDSDDVPSKSKQRDEQPGRPRVKR